MSKSLVKNILSSAGIQINGDKPWDIHVLNDAFYAKAIARGSLGLGESYMDRLWNCHHLDQFFHRVLSANLQTKIPRTWRTLLAALRARIYNMQSKKRSRVVAKQHYDLSTELYTSFLDPYNQYTCGYFKDTDDLNTAQEQKLDLICRKLRISSSDKVLDIGCGWGGFAKFAAEHYGCHVTGISISQEQIRYAKEMCKGLPVEILYCDYRDIEGTFDKVLICGMIEHVGYKNYRNIMEMVHRRLRDDGLFLLHTIGGNTSETHNDPWVDKYIFPGGMLPSPKQISTAIEGLFVMEDWHNLSTHYDKTLMAWYRNFKKNWSALQDHYDERFYRMWKYYFLSCAGSFRARMNQLWQIVLSKNGILGGYQSIR